MTSFLQRVAADILSRFGTDLSGVTVVFPNKRAALFLNEHLVRMAGKPLWSPAYITISDLFRSMSARHVADPLQLVSILHRVFTEQTGSDETLDHFFGWGQLLLSDFDDIDKQMADADRVLANITDLHELDDDSFLTPEQRQVLHRFFANFTEQPDSELRQRFLRLWVHLADIYHDFNNRLKQLGIAYEGALYREVVESPPLVPPGGDERRPTDPLFIPPRGDKRGALLFVGFNVLVKVEQQLFTHLHREGRATFYWDFDHSYLSGHEAGYFISQYLQRYPNALDSANDDIYRQEQPKHITIAAASSEDIQARYVATWLRADEQRIADGRRTAIVMCNEGLLPTVVHSLPEMSAGVNITTGYPLIQTPVASLLAQLIALWRDGYDHQRAAFRQRFVRTLQRHPYVRATADIDPLLLTTPPARHDNVTLLTWMCNVVKHIATSMHDDGSSNSAQDSFAAETLFRAYTLLNRLLGLSADGYLDTDIVTLGRLVTQLMQTTTVPFHGEPVEGVQIMGLLETRNLDFDHLLILSAQEGNLPRGTDDTSLVPYALRRAYGLTTPDHKVAIYSYYFHRLLQRATDITLVYNNATNDGQRGEMSRFLLQLMVESPHPVSHITLQGTLGNTPTHPVAVENRATLPPLLSPTAINRYMRCPLQFHYYYVEGLREPDDTDDETIDNRLFGNIFHHAAETVYRQLTAGGDVITAQQIDQMLKSPAAIERAVDEAIRSELQQTVRMEGSTLINRQVIIHYLKQLLALDRRSTPLRILALEDDIQSTFHVPSLGNVAIGGRADRIDMITTADGHQQIRVVDYKTGAHRQQPLTGVEAVFSQQSLSRHSDYYLQAMLYALIVSRQNTGTPVAPALLFIQHAGTDDYDPVLRFGRDPIADVEQHRTTFTEQLQQVVSRMYDPALPLAPTDDTQRCLTCPFRQLCW